MEVESMTRYEDTSATGLCECGCGEPTTHTYGTRYLRFVKGHRTKGVFLRAYDPVYLVEDCGHETPCWVWQRSRDEKGYGKLGRKENGEHRGYVAHRWMYEQAIGPIPVDTELDHLCKNKSCVNPDHMEPVSHEENCQRGASAKLTAEDARFIKQSKGVLRGKELAVRFNVNVGTIHNIWQGNTWKNV